MCGEFKTKARGRCNAVDVTRLSMDIGFSGYEMDVKNLLCADVAMGLKLCSADE